MTIEQLLIKHENIELLPYYDTTHHITIGVGRNLSTVGITKDESMYLLSNDINRTVKALQSRLSWYDSAPDIVKIVLQDMAFNLGIAGLLDFHTTLSMIQQGKYKDASVEMLLSRWARQVGLRAKEDSDLLAQVHL